MEKLKKTILQALTTGITACTGTTGTCYVIIPDTGVTYYVKFGLNEPARDLGFFDAYTEQVLPGPITTGITAHTGTTNNSRLAELRKYMVTSVFTDQYVSGGNWTTDGVDYGSSPDIEYVVYYIGGIRYVDETLIDGVTTTFSYTPNSDPNFIDVPYYKNMNKEKILGRPKIKDDVFIIRTEQSAFDKNYRLEYIRNLVDLTTYAGGSFFNIINNT